MARTTCIYTGHVQGVGFRYTVLNLATGRDVTGYVRNRGDGSVELVIEGTAAAREAMLDEIRARMGDYISDEEISESPGTGEFKKFEIRH